MTCLLLSEIFPPKHGGSGRWFWEMYRRFPRDEVVIAAGEDPRQDAFDRTHDLRLVRMPLSWGDFGMLSLTGIKGYWRLWQEVRQLIRAEGITQVHCARAVPCGWLGWLLKRTCGVSYSCYVHGEEVNLAHDGDASGVMASRQYRFMTRKALLGADRVIANSRNTRRILCDDWGVPAERVHLLYPGVDTARFVPAPPDAKVRQKLGWNERRVVLTVGRLQKRKGHDMLLRALPAIRRQIPDVLYAIAGDGEERPLLDALVQELGLGDCVQFLGAADDATLVQAYQQCDLFVLPNRQVGRDIEGFGMVLVEAQACGKPVVAGASGGTAETMRVPETGRVVPCDAPEELAKTVGDLLADPARLMRMGEAAREWAVESFEWDAVTRRARELFAERSAPRPRLVAEETPVLVGKE